MVVSWTTDVDVARPRVSSGTLDGDHGRVIDSSRGTAHMVLGGGGVSGTTNQAFFPVGKAKVITAVGAPPTP
jgi:hypothetical protein